MQHNLEPCPSYAEKRRWSVDFEVTVTLKGHLRSKPAEKQHEYIYEYIRALYAYGTGKTFFSTVVCEMHADFNLHFHCMMKVDLDQIPIEYRKEPRRFILDQFKKDKSFGMMTCTQIVDFHKWGKYLFKDVEKFKQTLHITPIIKDDYMLYMGILKFLQIEEDLATDKVKHSDLVFIGF